MQHPTGFTFKPIIPATRENARRIQKLTLQDSRRAGFTNPREIANPDDPELVANQHIRLADHPERYYGYFQGDTLVGFAKRADWLVGDELPFLEGFRWWTFRARQKLRMSRTGQVGVFGLVVSEDVESAIQRWLLTNLLTHSLTGPRGEEPTVNIVIYERDPLRDIAERLGFRRFGKPGEVPSAQGLLQWCYRRSVVIV